ncbi:hypothetical protein CJ030_MR5G025021 [Morella rubra]|uniref:Uncharacterized protein n=1 Tax=Morella rubra TaxID=262757 RepID=A0A6A1VHV9_9ROSI|nr:hypothetical protein CJ030_MR5G025021 [Morella rubra]
MESIGTEQKQTIRSSHTSGDTENPFSPLVNSMEKELESLPRLSTTYSIYRAPEWLCRGNEDYYRPHIVSIGPLHHAKEHLKAMEEHKMRYMKAFIERTKKRMEF